MIHERIKTTMPGPLHTSKSSFNQEWNFFPRSCYFFFVISKNPVSNYGDNQLLYSASSFDNGLGICELL